MSSTRACALTAALISSAASSDLPARYFQLISAGAAQVEARLNSDPNPWLESLEKGRGVLVDDCLF